MGIKSFFKKVANKLTGVVTLGHCDTSGCSKDKGLFASTPKEQTPTTQSLIPDLSVDSIKEQYNKLDDNTKKLIIMIGFMLLGLLALDILLAII